MNTRTPSSHSTDLSGVIAIAIFSALVSSFAAVCRAADTGDMPKAIVKYADLDVSTSMGAATLYNRIRFAAEGVCAPLDHGDLASKMHQGICVKQAIEGAVTEVNRPALTAVYETKYGAMRRAEFLTAQRR